MSTLELMPTIEVEDPIPMVLVVAAALIDSDGRVLIARRPSGRKMAGLWEFPGGKFEQGENAAQCLVREIKEELELDVSVHEEIGKWIFDHGDVVVRLHVWVCKIISGEMKLHVHDKITWCDNPNQVDWLGPDKDIATAISAKLPHLH